MRHLILILMLAFPAAAATRYPMLQPCGDALCGTIEVPENRAKKGGRKLAIEVMVIPAKSATPKPDPIVPITGGGPGIASLPEAQSWAKSYPELHETRDMIFWNQRGAGKADALDCPLGSANDALRALIGGELPLERVKQCHDELSTRADLTRYTTADAADDLEDIRRWLKVAKLNLYGSSYTSRLALVYAQRYPKRVRTLTVKAVTPVALRNPLHVARDAQASLDRLFADCAADPKCGKSYPNLRADFAHILANPPQVGEITLTPNLFAGIVRRMLYDADTQAALPLLITSVRKGEYAPLKPILGAGQRIDQLLNLGLFLSVTCAEDVAWFSEADIERVTRGTFSGATLASALKSACNAWTTAPLRHDYTKRIGVPALVISGVLDPDTPPVWGREMAKLLRGSVHVEVEGLAHTSTPPCVKSMVVAFIESGSNAKLPRACLGELRRPEFR